MSARDFFDVPAEAHATSEGPVELPIPYRDATLVQAFFWGEAAAAAPLLEGSGLVATRFPGGRALLGAAFFEYRETGIGAYNEMGLGVAVSPAALPPPRWPLLDLVRPPARRAMGFALLQLPVTTAAACAAGRELWGYPKFVAPIDVALDRHGFLCAVRHPDTGAPLATLTGAAATGPRLPSLDLLLYSSLEGTILRTVVDTRARVRTTRGGRCVLRAGPGEHPLADAIRRLGLDGAQPFLVQTTPRFQSLLHAGSPLAPSAGIPSREPPVGSVS